MSEKTSNLASSYSLEELKRMSRGEIANLDLSGTHPTYKGIEFNGQDFLETQLEEQTRAVSSRSIGESRSR